MRGLSTAIRRIEMKRKTIFGAILFLLTLSAPLSLFSQDFEIEDNVLVKYWGSAANVTIPEGVTTIGEGAFADSSRLTSVTIPSSVTSINEDAFQYCFRLTNITVDIQNNAYSSINGVLFNKDRTALILYPRNKQERNYNIPAGVTSIGNQAFSSCENLTSITIPSGVTSIGVLSFSGCSGLTSIIIPPSVASIGVSAFVFCDRLTSITISEGVTSIEAGAFIGCRSLTSVTIPSSVTFIGRFAFSTCGSLRNVSILAVDISIEEGVFIDSNSLETIVISRRANIGKDVFPADVKIIYSD
jgi:hypothetical protein